MAYGLPAGAIFAQVVRPTNSKLLLQIHGIWILTVGFDKLQV